VTVCVGGAGLFTKPPRMHELAGRDAAFVASGTSGPSGKS